MGESYRSAFTKNDLITADKALVTGQYNKLGQYVVQAGEQISIGYGALSGMDNAIGRIFAQMMDNSAAPGLEIKGKLRLSIVSPQDRPLRIIGEWRTEALNTNAADRTKQTPLPEGIELVTEDKKIVLEFLPDAAGTLSKTNSNLIFDITQSIA